MHIHTHTQAHKDRRKNRGNEKIVGTTESGEIGVTAISCQSDVEITSISFARVRGLLLRGGWARTPTTPVCANLLPVTPVIIILSCQGPQLEPRRMRRERHFQFRMDRLLPLLKHACMPDWIEDVMLRSCSFTSQVIMH